MMSTTEGELDIEVCHEREEGELEDSDVEDGTYIPLERPEAFNPPSLVHMQIQDEQSDEASPQDSSGSESDEPQRRPKRTKLRPKRPQPQAQPDKKDKYNVWTKALQEDLLTEDMTGCDVTRKSRYGVESYDYTIKYRLNDDYESSKKIFSNNLIEDNDRTSNKRRHADRANIKLRLGQRVNSHRSKDETSEPRFLVDLDAKSEDPAETLAVDIAGKLNEEKHYLVWRIVQIVGPRKAIELYKETQRIEADGGMMVMNGTRRRTPGGIFFFLLKRDADVSQDMVNQIFSDDRKEKPRKKRSRTKSRQKVMEQLKQSLTDSDLPALLSRGEATVQTEHGSNPPPSPATDAKDCSSDTDAHAPSPSPVDQSERANYHSRSHIDLDSQPQASINQVDQIDQSQRPLQGYEDDDFLEVMCNDEMDLF